MGAIHYDVLDDPDGRLVWTEIERAITLNEMIITLRASAPVFFCYKLAGPSAISTSLTKDHTVHGIEALAALASRHKASFIDQIAAIGECIGFV